VIISLIVAMDERRGIGKSGKLPWRLSADLKHFREVTMGHHLIIGRKTFESIGKPLQGRYMIVITRDQTFKAEGCIIERSIEAGFAVARERGENELFVVGGAQIYAQTLDAADRLYLTEVHAQVDADTFFPEFSRDRWIEKQGIDHPADEKNQYPFTFRLLERSRN
jgi:dihydrofolate reductase